MWAFSYTPHVCLPITKKSFIVLEEVTRKLKSKFTWHLGCSYRASGVHRNKIKKSVIDGPYNDLDNKILSY